MPRTLSTRNRHEGPPVRGSRFIVTMAPVSSENVAKDLLFELRSEMPDATHHCWAWRLAVPLIERAGDDGEPGGSAGRPMLGQLSGHDMLDVAVIVTRYFGGTKLGVGGLVRAYGGAVGEALLALAASGAVIEHQILTSVELTYGYAADRSIEALITELGGTTTSVAYGVAVRRQLSIPVGELERLASRVADSTAGQTKVKEIPEIGAEDPV